MLADLASRRLPSPLAGAHALLALGIAALAAACGPAESRPGAPPAAPPPTCVDKDGDGLGMHCSDGPDCDDTDPNIGSECPTETCVDGQSRDCKVTVGEHNGVVSCFEGTQWCVNGVWGECEAKPQ